MSLEMQSHLLAEQQAEVTPTIFQIALDMFHRGPDCRSLITPTLFL